MPSVYLSPSLQVWNPCALGDSEAQHMNYIADAMVPLFAINGITYQRNNLSQTLSQAIAESNRGNFDLHLALHSNAAPGANAGLVRGSRYYYQTNSTRGRQMADITVENMRAFYPLPDRVISIPTGDLAELNQTRAPAMLAEVAFHDNAEDAAWIHENIQEIAQVLMQSVCEFLGKSYIPPCLLGSTLGSRYSYTGLAYAYVCTETSPLNVRNAPNGQIMFTLPRGSEVIVISGRESGFIKIRYNHTEGYVSENYLCICNAPTLPFNAATGIVNTVSSGLNLRSEPSTTASILTTMPRGSTIVVLGSSGNFYQINYRGIIGYASKLYVKV